MPPARRLPPAQARSQGSGHSRLLEAAHAVQDVELLPPFGKVHLAVNIVRVPQVHEGEVLQDEPPGRKERPSYPPEVTQKVAGPPGRASADLAQAFGLCLRSHQRHKHFRDTFLFQCEVLAPTEALSDCPGLQGAVRELAATAKPASCGFADVKFIMSRKKEQNPTLGVERETAPSC